MITTLIALALIIAGFVALVASRPAKFRIERSILISAPAGAAFSQVNDLHRWQEMSPYAPLDPAAKYTFTGPPTGAGSSMTWAGNGKIGEGKLTILESRPDELVRMKLEFLKPFATTNTVEFTFEEEADQTRATWSMFGNSKFMCKAIGLFMNMDKMCGGQFDEGLANMKRIAETGTAREYMNSSRLAVA